MSNRKFDPVFATRVISDIVVNPWIGRGLVERLTNAVRQHGFTQKNLGSMAGFVTEELRKFLLREQDRLAEAHFMASVSDEHIQFRLRTDSANWHMPRQLSTDRPLDSSPLIRASDGMAVEKSVFAPVYRDDFNNDEAEFACYLDEQKALQWWHRNVARGDNYCLQGWRKHRVYPDFLFALHRSNGTPRLIVWEMKGDQLEGNLDTMYKKKLLQTLSSNFSHQHVTTAGKLDLVLGDKTVVTCDLVLMSQWKVKAPAEFDVTEK